MFEEVQTNDIVHNYIFRVFARPLLVFLDVVIGMSIRSLIGHCSLVKVVAYVAVV